MTRPNSFSPLSGRVLPLKFQVQPSNRASNSAPWRETQSQKWELPAGHRLYLDFGRKLFGRIRLGLFAQKETKIRIIAFPHPDAEPAVEFAAGHYKHQDFPLAWGTIIFPPIEVLISDQTQEWTDSHARAFRFLRIEADGDLHLTAVCVGENQWPGSYEGKFECSDPDINLAWEMGRRTLELCTQPALDSQHPVGKPGQWVLWDGCRRDREIWIGDLRPAALAHYSLSSNSEPVATSLRLAAAAAFENGLIPGSVSSRQAFNEYALWWIVTLWEYVYHTGDSALASELGPDLRRLLDWIQTHVSGSQGFFGVENSWSYTLPRKGLLCGANMVLSYAYSAAANLAKYCGLDADHYRSLASDQRARVLENYYDPDNCIFRDLPNTTDDHRVWEDNNALAILLGIARPEDSLSILGQLKSRLWGPFGAATCSPKFQTEELNPLCPWAHNGTIWPFANAYEVGAWMQSGQIAQGLDLLKRYTHACNRAGTETIWEMIQADGSLPLSPDGRYLLSLCHAWGATANHYIHRYVLGVSPLAEGWRKVKISPNLGNLEWATGSIPTPHGPIRIELLKDGASTRINLLEVPAEIEIEAPAGSKSYQSPEKLEGAAIA